MRKKCDCGRSPSPYCVGWHALTHTEWQTKRIIYEAKLRADLLEQECKDAMYSDDKWTS